ncbi:MAG: dihydropyrimidinase [Pseudomonadota bacterium]
MEPFDLVIRGGTVVTAIDSMACDVGVRDGRIAALAEGLAGRQVIDATGRLVLPGGIDTHCHIEQLSANGLTNADSWESATRSAALGGTTTVIPFACQHRGMRLKTVAEEYHALAARGAVIDYALHLILADPTEETLEQDLPPLVAAGHGSIKIFMTYDAMQLSDAQVLDVLAKARALGALVCAHAENHGMIDWISRRLVARGYTAPRYHAISHPRGSEAEAFTRLIAMAELLDQPVMIFHVSTAEGAAVIREARGRGVKVWGETCPQYLFLTAEDLDRPGAEGAKFCCSPPPRTEADQAALWRALALGDLQTVSSDHAPFAFDASGKLVAGPEPAFKQIPNGLPGLHWRLPLLFDAMVHRGFGGLMKFVWVTAAEAAWLYGLHPSKGSIAIGQDADLAIWDPDRAVTITDAMVEDQTGYTPYAGREVRGWPMTVLSRGRVVVEEGALTDAASPGSGQFLARQAGPAAAPTGRASAEFDPARNFGAVLE